MWVNNNLIVLAKPLAVLYPVFSSGEYILSFEIARPCDIVNAEKFAHAIKVQNIYLGLLNVLSGELN